MTFAAKETKTVTFSLLTNQASTTKGAVASGNGIDLNNLIDDTENTVWASLNSAPVAGKQVTIDILPSAEIETERLRVLSPEEEEKLFVACDTVKGGRDRKHIKPLLIFAIETGMRRSEIRSVCWSDVDFESNTICVRQQNTKTERPREIPIEPLRLLPLLLKLKSAAKSDSNRIFGYLPGSCRKPFETACRLAGIVDLRFHDLRATFITRAIERNISPEIVRKVSGHKQDKAFQRYLRFSKKSLNEAFFPLQ